MNHTSLFIFSFFLSFFTNKSHAVLTKLIACAHKNFVKKKNMIRLEDFFWGFSIISLALYFLQSLRKAISMASLCLNSPSNSSLPSPVSWVSQFQEDYYSEMKRKGGLLHDINLRDRNHETQVVEQKITQENMHNYEAYQKGLHDKYSQEIINSGHVLIDKELDYLGMGKGNGNNITAGGNVSKGPVVKLKKRPAMLVVPEYCPKLEFGEKNRKVENEEFEIQGKNFFLASKKGRRQIMEDGYGVMVDVLGDAKQAFFAVIDGHGGRAAADYVAQNLGKNIVKALDNVEKKDNCDQQLEQAIRRGYLVTDQEFLSQGISSGACAASVLLKGGEIHVANVGDCRVVLSRRGVAHALTVDHRVSREDERLRIENSGGFVHCRNGIWRVQASLAISRAIGDLHLKDWIISEPEIKRVPLTSDCEFLVMASDGLWDKVDEQEAVDAILEDKNSVEACKKLVDKSFIRGNMDDITVMVVNLQNFMAN